MAMRRDRVLISHHRSDNRWRERLRKWLKQLELLQKTRVWDRTVVKVGEKPEEEYQRALEEARLAIPLVSPDYLADEALISELQSLHAVVGHELTLLWIAVDYSPWTETILTNHTPANDAEMPLKALDSRRSGKEMKCIYDKIKLELERYSTNLPDRQTIKGREQELSDLVDLLRQNGVRLVTLTGSAGVGKTILAIEVAHQLLRDFEHGVLWIDLRGLNDHSLVHGEIAHHLDRIKPDRVTEENLINYISDRKMLMVLDNFEPVSAAAHFVVDLLNRAPQLKVLVTSRSPVPAGISEQREYELLPLDQNDSVQLMLDLARQVLGESQLDEHQVETLATIAKELAGNPLAIQLRAAEVAVAWEREIPDS